MELASTSKDQIVMEPKRTTKDGNKQVQSEVLKRATVFGASIFGKPTYRIPALVYLNFRFLAFSEKRLTGSKDYGPMEMVLRRGYLEEDNNVIWGNEITLYPVNKPASTRPMNAVPIVVKENHIVLMFNTYPVDMPQSEIKNSDNRLWHLMMIHSYDGGETWDPPQEIPVDDIFVGESYGPPLPSYCAIGPGHGIQLESGRLVVPGNVAWPSPKGKGKSKGSLTFVIISDDEGRTWKMGGDVPKYNISGSECQAVDMGSGNVVINCRTGGTHPRIQRCSSDDCNTFDPSAEVMQTLIEPKGGCEGSIFGFKSPLENDPNMMWVLFSNPAANNESKERKNLSVRLSKDGGCKDWTNPPVLVLEAGGSAYSDLTGFKQNGQQKFACLFERIRCFCSRSIVFVIFTIKW